MRAALVLLLCTVVVQVAQGDIIVPLCSTLRGFASEINYKFSVSVPLQPRQGEAVVLVIRPVPYSPGMTWVAARMNATYKVHGIDTYVISDQYGILQITDEIEPDTNIFVRITNLRSDGSTPFQFYGYHAGYRSCSLDLTPSASFTGPIPTHIFNSNSIATLYLKAVPPQGAVAYQVNVVGTVSVTQSLSAREDGTPVAINNPTALESSAAPLYFTVRPTQDMSRTQMVHVAIAWQLDPQGRSTTPQAPVLSAGDGAPVSFSPAFATDSARPSMRQKVAAEASGSLFSVVFILTLAYFTTRSIYNYRVQHITTFPEFIPHHEFFSSCSSFCGTFASQVKNRGQQAYFSRRGGYNDVNRAEDEM